MNYNDIPNNQKNNDSKKIITLIALIATVMITTTGATYAYFALSVQNTTTATGTAATASLTLAVQEMSLKSGNTGVMVPQLDGSGLATAMNGTNKCVDGNNNIVCKVYQITVTNTSSSAVLVNGTIQFVSPTTNLKWKRVSSGTVAGSTTTGSYTTKSATTTRTDLISGSACTPTLTNSSGCTGISLAKTNGTQTYYVVIWINETSAVQTDSGTWKATITFEGAYGVGVTSTIRA